MSKRPRQVDEHHHAAGKIARATRRRLGILIAVLGVILFSLIFEAGAVLWPAWLIQHRTLIIGVLGFVLLVVIAASPILIEFSSNPRHLSGPGHAPHQGGRPSI